MGTGTPHQIIIKVYLYNILLKENIAKYFTAVKNINLSCHLCADLFFLVVSLYMHIVRALTLFVCASVANSQEVPVSGATLQTAIVPWRHRCADVSLPGCLAAA